MVKIGKRGEDGGSELGEDVRGRQKMMCGGDNSKNTREKA